MRRSIGSIAALALLGACGKALTVDDVPDGGTPDAGVPRDDPTVADASGAEAAIDAGTGSCLTFDNTVLVVEPGNAPRFVRSFTADREIKRSIVDIEMNVVIASGTWSGYFGLLALGYGDGYDYNALPVTSFSVTPDIEANVWRVKGSGPTYYTFRDLNPLSLPQGDVHMHVDVTWGNPGSIAISMNTAKQDALLGTLEGLRQRMLTVAIGGGDSGTYPRHTVTLKSICVAFE